MQPKIKDVNNKGYLTNICVRMKHILKLWYGVMRRMKSVDYQTDEDCKRFEENTIELNKALHLLIDDPPIPGSGLKHSNQLKAVSCLMGTSLILCGIGGHLTG